MKKILVTGAMTALITALYYYFAFTSSLYLFEKYEEPKKTQFTFILMCMFAIVALIISYTFFLLEKKNRFKNSFMKYGMFMASIFIFTYSICLNWKTMDEFTHMVILGLGLLAFVWMSYQLSYIIGNDDDYSGDDLNEMFDEYDEYDEHDDDNDYDDYDDYDE